MNIAKKAQLGVGVGLRSCHYDWVVRHLPPVAWFEITSENFMISGGRPLGYLDQIREHYPISLHGVSLSLGSMDPTPNDYLNKLSALIERTDPLWVSDHLCWTGVSGMNGHDLWPLPYTQEAMLHLADKISRVQDRLRRQILVENVSTYLEFRQSSMPEWEFLSAVAERADCGILLDINNIFVNAHNHGLDPQAYLRGIPAGRVREIHLAGPSARGNLLIDTHDHPVQPECWRLFDFFLQLGGPRPTLLEWDENIPEFPELHREALKAQERIDRSRKTHGLRPKENPGTVLVPHPSA